MRRDLMVIFVAMALIVAACLGGAREPDSARVEVPEAVPDAQTFTLGVGFSDKNAPLVDFLAFYPDMIRVHAGDTIRLDNATAAVPHTVTFGVAADRSNQPAPVLPAGGPNPVVWGPCVSDAGVSPGDTACPGAPEGGGPPPGPPPSEVALPAFQDQAYFNSGVFIGGQTAVLEVSEDLQPGVHPFVCLLHPTMTGTLSIVPDDEDTQEQDELTTTGDEQVAADRADAEAVQTPTPAAGTVQAGAVGRRVSIERFFPDQLSVEAGDVVTWTNPSHEPHTVTLGEVLTPDDPRVLGLPTIASGSAYASGLAHSGLFGGPPFPSSSFALRFPNAGTYTYTCSIHPGMVGKVEVTPA
jgi:plastocyanin